MTARPQDVALLPCPFCGSACELVNMSDSIFVACAGSDCMGLLGGFDSDAEATSRWNTRANVTAALASAQAREEELRAEVLENEGAMRVWRRRCIQAEARAERLEEALRSIRDVAREPYGVLSRAWVSSTADAALSTNAATQTGETK